MASSFKINRELLNVNFEGYKLSEKTPKHIKYKLDDGLKRVKLKNDCFSFQLMRQVTMKNLLHSDQWNKGNNVYWISENRKIMTACMQSVDSVAVLPVFQDMRTLVETMHTSNPSLVFVSATNALYYDPEVPNSILLLNTGYRHEAAARIPWEAITHLTTPASINDFVIESAHMSNNDLYMIVSSLKPQSRYGCTVSVLQATVMIPLQEDSEVECVLVWSMSTSSTPLYCDITTTDNILIVCESDLKSLHEHHGSDRPPPEANHQHSGLGYDDNDPAYTWTQTDDDVTIVIPIPPDVSKTDIHCVIATDSLVVGLTDGTTYIRGRLSGRVDPNGSIWTIDKDKLELTVVLEKAEGRNDHWSVLLGGSDCEMKDELPLTGDVLGLTAEEMEQLKDRLDTMNTASEGNKRISDGPVDSDAKRPKPIFQNTLEDCDVVDNEQQIKYFIISKEGQIINKVSLGSKHVLFSLPPSRDSPPFLCLKHDIDALMFSLTQPSDSSPYPGWTHSHTFNALGYVQASKREKRFLTCDSTCSCAVLTECSRHVFIYMQPNGGNGPRDHIRADQYVHTFTDNEDIVGVYAAGGGVVFVLCEMTLNLLLIDF